MTRLDRIEKGIEALQKSQLRTDQLFANTDLQMAKLAEQQAKTEAQIERNAMQLAETKRILSGVGINLGDAAEDFFPPPYRKRTY